MSRAAIISKAQGIVIVERHGQTMELTQGDVLFSSDIIKTQNTPVELTFADKSIATLGPHTEMHIKDFIFDNEEPSFVMELATGAMRSISGAVVEHNPDAFKVITPMATVGVRGTDFIINVLPGKSEEFLVLAIDQAHNLVITTHDGQQISLTSPLQGAFIGTETDGILVPRIFSQEEINILVQKVSALLNEELDKDTSRDASKDEERYTEEEKRRKDEERYTEEERRRKDEERADEEEQSSFNGQTSIILAEAALGEENARNLAHSLADAGIDVSILSTPPPPTQSESLKRLTAPHTDFYDKESDNTHSLTVFIDGKTDYFADGRHAIGIMDTHHITITGDVTTGVVISGDTDIVTQGSFIGGNDTIVGQNMSDGTLAGDALAVTGGTFVGGKDTITLLDKTGGQSVYGDARDITNNSTVSLGDDRITISGTFVNSTVSGDINTLSDDVRVLVWGNDTIIIEGDMGSTNAHNNTYIYGDSSSNTHGGDDTITVYGTMYAGSTILAGGGSDTVALHNTQGGIVDLGDENIADTLHLHGTDAHNTLIVNNFKAVWDSLYIGGVLYTPTGNGMYANYHITFNNIQHNLAPEIATPAVTLAITESSAEHTTESVSHFVDATDPEGQSLTYSLSSTPAYGSVTLSETDGQYTYTLNNDHDAVNAIAAGETITDSFIVTVDDGRGGTAQQTVTVTITGTNDAPKLTITATSGTTKEDSADTTATGSIAVTDIDSDGDVQTLRVDGKSADATTNIITVEGDYGNIALNVSTGEYIYTMGVTDTQKAVVDALEDGQSVQESFAVTTTDKHGANDAGTLIINVQGTNDAPTVESVDDTLTVVESGVKDVGGAEGANEAFSGTPVAGGTIVGADAEGQDLTYTLQGGETSSAGQYVNGNLGIFVVNGDGTYIYTLRNDWSMSQSLNEGEHQTETFTIIVTDSQGKSTQQDVSVNITGTNDQPIINLDKTAMSFTENAAVTTATGTVTVKDVDEGGDTLAEQTLSVNGTTAPEGSNIITIVGTYGNMELNTSTGEYTYAVGVTDEQKAAVDKLENGDVMDETFIVSTADAYGANDSQDVIIKVEGTNDVPRISLEDSEVVLDVRESGVLDGGDTATEGSAIDTGKLVVSDIEGHDMTFSLEGDGGGTYGTFTLNADGTYSYALNNSLDTTQALNSGQGVTEKFTVTVTDSQGGKVSQEVVVNVTGTNDQPIISLDNTDMTFTEATATVEALVGTGTVTVTDVDADGDTLVEQTLTVDGVAAPEGSNIVTVEGQYGNIELNTTTGKYTYTMGVTDAQKALVESFAEGKEYTEAFTVRTTDEHASFTEQLVNITITGTNDAPTIKADDPASLDGGADGTGIGVVESGVKDGDGDPNAAFAGTSKVEGTLDVNALAEDVDQGATLEFVATTQTGTYGELVLNADGTYSYTLDNTDGDTQALNKDQTVTETFTVQITDEHDVTVDKHVEITVTGTNDQPIISINENDRSVVEDGVNASEKSASGVISVKDADADGDTLGEQTLSASHDGSDVSAAESGGDVTIDGTYGQLVIKGSTGSYMYTIGVTDAQKAAVDALDTDDAPTDVFTIRTTDKHDAFTEQDITIFVQGANDAPVIADDSDISLSVQEAGVILDSNTDTGTGVSTSTGTLNVTDAEGDPLTYALEGMTSETDGSYKLDYGTLTLDGKGGYTYTLDNTLEEVNSMDLGDSLGETFTIVVDDGKTTSTQEITVNIAGTNDRPTIDITQEDNLVVENSANRMASGIITTGDADPEDNFLAEQSFSITQGTESASATEKGGDVTIEGEFGNLTINGETGEYLYTLGVTAEQKANVEGLSAGDYKETFTVRTTDPHGAWSEADLSIDIKGTNDAPVLVDPAPLNITEGGGVVESGVKLDADGDANKAFAGDNEAIGKLDVNTIATDVDTGDALTFVGGTFAGTFGTLVLDAEGNYTYTLNNADGDTQALTQGQKTTDSITVYIDDGAGGLIGKVLQVSVEGTNDKPTITSVATDSEVTEDSADIRATGNIRVSDVDADGDSMLEQTLSIEGASGEEAFAAGSGQNVSFVGEYGTLTMNGVTGEYIYELGTTPEQVTAVNKLAEGQTMMESFDVTITDAHGAHDTTQLEFTINGTNDLPVVDAEKFKVDGIKEAGVDAAGNATAGVALATGTLSSTDEESLSENLTYSILGDGTGVYGKLELNADGSYTYTLDNDDFHTQKLIGGERAKEVFQVQVEDEHGGVTVQEFVVNIEGTNDAPTLTVLNNTVNGVDHTTYENSIDKMASGALQSAHVGAYSNGIHTHIISVDGQSASAAGENLTVEGEFGTITFYGDTGAYLYTLGVTEQQRENIAKQSDGATVQESFDVTITDFEGATSKTEQIVIDVHTEGGSVEEPGASPTIVDLAVIEAGTQSADGYLDSEGLPLTQGYIIPENADSVAGLTLKGGTVDAKDVSTLAGKYGTLTLNPDGTYVFVLDNDAEATQNLAEGQHGAESFEIVVTYDDGSTKTETVDVTVTGTNDKAQLEVKHDAGNVLEEDGATQMLTGKVNVLDPDSDASQGTFTVDKVEADEHGNVTVVGTYGTLTLAPDGSYVYELGQTDDQKLLVNALPEGAVAQENFDVRNTDAHGAFNETDLSFTVVGSNDKPTVTDSKTELTVNEAGSGVEGIYYTQGYIDAIDVDTGSSLTYSFADGSAAEGTYGTLTLHDDGSFEYRMDEARANSLAEGATETDTFIVLISDGLGGYVTKDVVVTIEGSNDAPVVSTATAPGTVSAEDMPSSTTSGSVHVTDVDSDFTFSVNGVEAQGSNNIITVVGNYGNIAFNINDGTYEYTLGVTPDQIARIDAFGEGQSTAESFTITATDEGGASSSQVVTISIVPENNAPTISVDESVINVTVKEAGSDADGKATSGREQAQGFLIADDVDGDHVTFVLDGVTADADGNMTQVGEYGSLTLNEDGSYVYTLDNDNPKTQAIATGEKQFDEFTVTFDDGKGGLATQVVTVTVNGTDDTTTRAALPAPQNMQAPQDTHTVTSTGTVTHSSTPTDEGYVHETVTVNGDMTGGSIRTGAGKDLVSIKGQMQNGFIDAGAGDDMLIIGAPEKGMTQGTITGGEGADSITVFVGDAGSKGSIIIDASGMRAEGEAINIFNESTQSQERHITITGLNKDTQYAGKTFMVDTVDITTELNLALENNAASYKHDDLIIHFSNS